MPDKLYWAYRISLNGLVQGVGFRPFVYRLAHERNIQGWIKNSLSGVEIHAEGFAQDTKSFIEELALCKPPAAYVEQILSDRTIPENYQDFKILPSEDNGEDITLVSPDIGVCDECILDMERQFHRIAYPFINCTNCGPRFSIIRDLPYDRPNTTMDVFSMCPDCAKEYQDPLDRRFHAQPIACNHCGPVYTLVGEKWAGIDPGNVPETLAEIIESGGIAALKGIGGFHLMCDAMQEKAVRKLREGKLREGKPFAVLFADIHAIHDFALVKEEDVNLLLSWQRPIVILRVNKPLAPSVCNGFSTIGAMLPYTPLHHLFFKKSKLKAVVLTSGNISDEPIILDNRVAEQTFLPEFDAVIHYNRDIHNRTDDSVCFSANGISRIIRRSRGFAPFPVRVKKNVEGILACGAELSNCFALGRKDLVFLSQHIGDLKNFETHVFFKESIDRSMRLFRLNPRMIVADLHPDYLSTQYALGTGLPMRRVQHHHAHIAACMAENGHSDAVIGVAFDGTGLGEDGSIWGGEFFVCDFLQSKRVNHLPPIALPGGDKVTHEPWRTAVSVLFQQYGNDLLKMDLPFLRIIAKEHLNLVLSALEKNINSPVSTSAGRWFDAIAAMINLCTHSTFHAEAPMRLESIIDPGEDQYYPFDCNDRGISFTEMISCIVRDILGKQSPEKISARFHNTLIKVILSMAERISHDTGIRVVALSGGAFQNHYLLERTESMLKWQGFSVLSHSRIPSNDGGIALGQIVVAASREGL